MNVDDLSLVSIDDHVVEPLDMFLNHVPALPITSGTRRYR